MLGGVSHVTAASNGDIFTTSQKPTMSKPSFEQHDPPNLSEQYKWINKWQNSTFKYRWKHFRVEFDRCAKALSYAYLNLFIFHIIKGTVNCLQIHWWRTICQSCRNSWLYGRNKSCLFLVPSFSLTFSTDV